MNDYEPTIPGETTTSPETPPPDPASGNSSAPAVEDSRGATSTSLLPPASSSGWPASAKTDKRAEPPREREPLAKLMRALIVGTALVGSVTGLFVGLGLSSTAGAAQSVSGSSSSGQLGSGGQRSDARSGPAPGGSSGTVGNVANSSFTLTTSAGQEVTVDEPSSTKYVRGTSPTSKSAVAKGEHVLALGIVSSTTIKATEITVQTTGSGSESSAAAAVVPFQKGVQGASKQVGQIPASYSQGSGTIVSGTTANKATEAALTAYPGGIVDRVVKLNNGEYEVHNIGVNWPHHIFVNQAFKVVGAE
jgi:hypothetical protein